MIRIAICDDEKRITDKIESLLERNLKENHIVSKAVDVYNSSQNLLSYINEKNEYDLIYLDIEMPEMDGIALAQKIRENNREVIFIYISSYENYFVQLFPVMPFRFLKKPVDENQFAIDFVAAFEEINRKDYYFHYDYRGVRYRIPTKDIIYFESFGRNVYVVTKSKKSRYLGKLGDVEKQLAEQKAQFLRIHQSYLINASLMEVMNYDYITMCNGERLRISQERRKQIRELYFGMEK